MPENRIRYAQLATRRAAFPWGSVAILLAVLLLVYVLRAVIAPFVAAAVLAYVFWPLRRWLGRYMPSSLAALFTLGFGLLVVIAGVLIVLPLVIRQGSELMARLPSGFEWVQTRLNPWLVQHIGYSVSLDMNALQTWATSHANRLSGLAGTLLPSLKAGSLTLLGWLAQLAILPVALFYCLKDGQAFVTTFSSWVPPRWHRRFGPVWHDIDAVLGEFLHGQLSVMATLAFYYTAALALLGLDYALPVGMITGCLCFIPYLGFALGLLLATVSGWLEFGAGPGLLWIWGIFLIGQLLEGFVVVPWLVGERIGLHPLAVVLALMAFGQLFGFVGVLLALPLAAILLVGLRHVRPWYQTSGFYRG